MNQVALEIAQYIEEQEYGTLGTDLFVDTLPDVSRDVIAVFNTGGSTPDIDLPIGSPNFEVLIRGESAGTIYGKLSTIVEDLHQTYNEVLVTGGNHYYSILLSGEINTLGRDDKGRMEYSANFNCKVRGR
jgi:hypothetical protein